MLTTMSWLAIFGEQWLNWLSRPWGPPQRVVDLVGMFVFALSGAVAGVKHRMDLFRVLVLSFVACSAGGITRDVFIGTIPPASFRDWQYITLSLLAGFITFFWYPLIAKMRS